MEHAVDIAALLAADSLAVAASRGSYSLKSMSVEGELTEQRKEWLRGLALAAPDIGTMVLYLVNSQTKRLSTEREGSEDFTFVGNPQQLQDLLAEFESSAELLREVSEAQSSDDIDPQRLEQATKALEGVLRLCDEIRTRELPAS